MLYLLIKTIFVLRHKFDTGVSDCHHMISTFIKSNTQNCVKSKTQYRSFKYFDVNKYISDLE